MKFQCGDRCEIVDHSGWSTRLTKNRKFIGAIVILTRLCKTDNSFDPWLPRWHIVGRPSAKVSEKILRKLPPLPPLEEDITEELTV